MADPDATALGRSRTRRSAHGGRLRLFSGSAFIQLQGTTTPPPVDSDRRAEARRERSAEAGARRPAGELERGGKPRGGLTEAERAPPARNAEAGCGRHKMRPTNERPRYYHDSRRYRHVTT